MLLALAGWLRYRFVFDWHPPEHFVFSDMAGYVDHDAHEIVLGEAGEHQTFQPIGYSLALALSLRWVGDLTLAGWSHVLLGWATVALITWRATTHRWLRKPGGAMGTRDRRAALRVHLPHLGFFLRGDRTSRFSSRFSTTASRGSHLLHGEGEPRLLHRPRLHVGVVAEGQQHLLRSPPRPSGSFSGSSRTAPVPRRLLARRLLLVPVIALCAGAAVICRVVRGVPPTLLRARPTSRLLHGVPQLHRGQICPEKRNMDGEGHGGCRRSCVQLGESEQKRWPRPFTEQGLLLGRGRRLHPQGPLGPRDQPALRLLSLLRQPALARQRDRLCGPGVPRRAC